MKAKDSIDELIKTAEEGARRAGRVLKEKLGQERTIQYKGGIDLVTDADKASEQELLSFIRSRHPEHAILSEESGVTQGAKYRWVVDPLDGTTNYSHRLPHFSVSVGLEGPEGLLAGVIYDPMRDECFRAVKGGGAFLNDRPIRASAVKSLEQALLCTGFPADVRENPRAPLGLFTRFIQQAQGVRRLGSAALDLAYVAAGRFDGFFEFRLHAWDIAAGALIVQEAGGIATRIDGAPVDLEICDILACAPGLAPVFTRQCAEFLAEIGYRAASAHASNK